MTGKAIEVKARQTFGSNANRRLRKEGMIPGVVYGQGKESIAIAVEIRPRIKNVDAMVVFLSQVDLNLE